ncbi:hypothetical protein BKA56DRAFT_600227 [Ilyonectria sp. MPI-CAGE-AT-0026]|nr:hypothetical protein BKA56DRAFT_600227 [Ilyonectria sp. MPI-CAGE-AT-0026]
MAAGAMGRPVGTALNLPRLNTKIPQPTHAGAPAMSSHPHVHQTQSARQEFQSSPSIYFHRQGRKPTAARTDPEHLPVRPIPRENEPPPNPSTSFCLTIMTPVSSAVNSSIRR